jgi:hypothetical protein
VAGVYPAERIFNKAQLADRRVNGYEIDGQLIN